MFLIHYWEIAQWESSGVVYMKLLFKKVSLIQRGKCVLDWPAGPRNGVQGPSSSCSRGFFVPHDTASPLASDKRPRESKISGIA